MADPHQRATDTYLRLREDLTPQLWKTATEDAGGRLRAPDVDASALEGLKFSTALPRDLAEATLAARITDFDGAAEILAQPVRETHLSP